MAKKIVDYLKDKKYHLYTAPEQKAINGTKSIVSSNELKEMSLIIVLGGDGTYLRAVRLLRGNPVPILGFNMGSLGFLTSHPVDEVFEIINQTLQGKMVTHSRSRLHAKVTRKNKADLSFDALNDIVIERGSNSQLISTALTYNNSFVNDIKADGLIVSTPTGSTAYNLAAGGPIVHPEAQVIIVTAVAPHSLTNRPLIFPDHQKLVLKLHKQASSAHLVIDGQKVTELTPDDEVTISRCDKDHLMIRKPHHNFFMLLKEKLNFGDRDATRT